MSSPQFMIGVCPGCGGPATYHFQVLEKVTQTGMFGSYCGTDFKQFLMETCNFVDKTEAAKQESLKKMEESASDYAKHAEKIQHLAQGKDAIAGYIK